jgi:hypothetical protein
MADRQVIVRCQDRRHRARVVGMARPHAGPGDDVIPGRRHDAADQTSGGRHLTLAVPDPGGVPVLRSAPGPARDCGLGSAGAASVRAGRCCRPGALRPARRARPRLLASPTGNPGRCALLRPGDDARRRAWNDSWNGAPDNPSTAGAMSAITRAIGAARALSARGRTYGKEKVYGSIP